MSIMKVLSTPVSDSKIASAFRDRIALRAYGKWLQRCSPMDRQLGDWLEAEAEIACEASSPSAVEGQSKSRLSAEHAVARILTASKSLIEAAPNLLRAVCQNLAWEVGVVWLLDRDAQLLRCLDVWHSPSLPFAALEVEVRLQTHARGLGIPGRVWESELPLWTAAADCNERFASAFADEVRWRTELAYPVQNRGEFVGVFEFSTRELRDADDELVATMTSIAGETNRFVERCWSQRQLDAQAHDLLTGREIQEGFLPSTMPRLAGFEVGGRWSSPDQVGGDCFDFIPLAGQDSLAILVADASGHGIGAALLAMHARAFLCGLATTCGDVGRLLANTNRRLGIEQIAGHFVTAFLMRIDAGKPELTYSSAGHLPGYVLDSRGQIKTVLASTGLPLGVDEADEFPSARVRLQAGDAIVVFTDGVVEACSPNGEPFGVDRVLQIVRRLQARSPDDTLTALFRELASFCCDHFDDDFTTVIAKVGGQPAGYVGE